MFCPNCGEKLESQDQRFCARCGSEILSPSVPAVPQLPAEEIQVQTPTSSVPIYDSKPIKVQGLGSHSKKCFSYSLVSIAFFIVGFIFGVINLLRFILPFHFFPFLSRGFIMWIIAIVLHFVGLIFGILSRVNSKRARNLEADHALEKVGSVFGVFGIILNVLPMVILPIFIGILTLNLYIPIPYF